MITLYNLYAFANLKLKPLLYKINPVYKIVVFKIFLYII